MTAEDIGRRFMVLLGLPFVLAMGVIAGIIWAVARVKRLTAMWIRFQVR